MRKFDFTTSAKWRVEDAVVGISKLGTVRMLLAGAVGKVSHALAPPELGDAMGDLTVVTDEELAQIEETAAAED